MYIFDLTKEERKELLLEIYEKLKVLAIEVAVALKAFYKRQANKMLPPYLLLGSAHLIFK